PSPGADRDHRSAAGGPVSSARTLGLRLALRGLWFRRSTAAIVLVLAVMASAASAVAPIFSRAAEESILKDTLRRYGVFSRSVHISVPDVGAAAPTAPEYNPSFVVQRLRTWLPEPALGAARVAWQSRGVIHPRSGPDAGSK